MNPPTEEEARQAVRVYVAVMQMAGATAVQIRDFRERTENLILRAFGCMVDE